MTYSIVHLLYCIVAVFLLDYVFRYTKQSCIVFNVLYALALDATWRPSTDLNKQNILHVDSGSVLRSWFISLCCIFNEPRMIRDAYKIVLLLTHYPWTRNLIFSRLVGNRSPSQPWRTTMLSLSLIPIKSRKYARLPKAAYRWLAQLTKWVYYIPYRLRRACLWDFDVALGDFSSLYLAAVRI